MYCKPMLDFFLGALSPGGFRGWFAEAAAVPGITPYLIKAGPGCGKSTLMRRLGEADAARSTPRGQYAVERLHCSSDAASLDGVLLWDAGAIVLDATHPHTLDCKFPGAAERVVSLYHAFDDAKLAANRNAILALGRQNAAYLQQAAASFTLACGLLTARRATARAALRAELLQAFAARFAARCLPKQHGKALGEQLHRLLSAPTPDGMTFFYDTIPQLAGERLYVLHDSFGPAADAFLTVLANAAQRGGYTAYLCHCPTDQDRVEHLFIPALELGFVTANRWHPMHFAGQRSLYVSRFYDKAALQRERGALCWQQRTAGALLQRTTGYEKKAKAAHDALEHYYIASADFAAVDAVTAALEKKILL